MIKHRQIRIRKRSTLHAIKAIDQLRNHLQKWFEFFNAHDPLFFWWVARPYRQLTKAFEDLIPVICQKIVGIPPDKRQSAIAEEPIGRERLLAHLEAEMIPYPPEELLSIGQSEYAWCEEEMIKASTELGYGRDWHRALEFVKTLRAEQGQQAQLVHDGVLEAIEFVTKQHDLVTVPPLAAKAWKMDMVSPSPEFQSAAFVGGEKMVAAYSTVHMSHESKLASMRTNNIHFSHSTGFHEVIPDHHLQLYMNVRHRTYRALFYTPFWIEGGAMHWEMLFWDKKFPTTPEDKI
ncbi:X-Pro dipeptidyl-peptidase [Histoplasma capsulatum H143]|uniref:X-Pro dipeptidyl-peptidase n=2 Tax=Ajellomyces capsulatus TaxID=5037 RepID=C6HLK8_AJECH|nr:X-Pro dipeptidyl-peptidase [Histoplasma capsulatum H143]